jgi:TPR repeat protein
MKIPSNSNLPDDSASAGKERPGVADAETNNTLGVIYASRGEAGFVAAAGYFQKAADQGHSIAQNNLALMHAAGLGMNKNWGEATRWFERGAAQGDAGAQYHLGVHCHRASMLHDGGPVRESRIEAYKWFQLAAQQGYWKADVCLERVNLQMDREEVTEAARRVSSFVVKKEN